jgi:hypothetical protein
MSSGVTGTLNFAGSVSTPVKAQVTTTLSGVLKFLLLFWFLASGLYILAPGIL